jgi:hypothetical protein
MCQNARSDLDEIELLLKRLNWWQRESGLPVHGTSVVRSSGESNAAIADIKRKLAQLGARLQWSEGSREWRLVISDPIAQKDVGP